MFGSFKELLAAASQGSKKKRIVVAGGHDEAAIEALSAARKMGLAEATLVGDADKMAQIAKRENLSLDGFEVVDCREPQDIFHQTLSRIQDGRADILMKGCLPTGDLMRAVLDKQYGLRADRILSHIAVFEREGRLKILTDPGLNIAPDVIRKVELIGNAVELARILGMENPKVAMLAAVEKAQLLTMPATRDAIILQRMNERGEIKNCLVEGPISLDIAISRRAAEIKGYKGKIQGDADILVAPAIESANVLYKAITTLQEQPIAAVVFGAKIPCIVVSRAESPESKLYTIALSLLIAAGRGPGRCDS